MQLLDPAEAAKPKELKSITSQWMKSGAFEEWKDKVKPFNFDHLGKFTPLTLPRAKPGVDYSKTAFHSQCATVTPDRLKALLDRTRKHKTTVMGLTWAASAVGTLTLLKTYGKYPNWPTNFLFRTPVNLRGIHPEFGVQNSDLTFGSFPILVPLKISAATNVCDIATATRNQMNYEIKAGLQEKQFFCKHCMDEVTHPEPPNTVNGTSIGNFKFKDVYPSGHRLIDLRWLVTYKLCQENALIHIDNESLSHIGARFNIAYMWPIISDAEGETYTDAVQKTLDLLTDSDNVSIGDLEKLLLLK
jgi:hypothetical protein